MEDNEPELTVVGVGASAGGLDALKAFFSEVPADSGLAFVVVVHLSPDHASHLAEILQPSAPIPIEQVQGDTRLEPDHAYVIPPGRNLSAMDTHLRLVPLEASRRDRAPIDRFLRTLSETHGARAVGVILSGTGSDGTTGIRHVKEKGGLTIAQEPTEALYDGMPQRAIATGLVDRILAANAIPEEVIRYARTRPRIAVPSDDAPAEANGLQTLYEIFALLGARKGRDFTRYKRSTVARRIRRRMQLHHMEEIEAYLRLLREDTKEVSALADELLITVTSFFRDPDVYAFLAQQVVPEIFERKGAEDRVRAWSVGCSTGEEAYSLAILLREEAERRAAAPAVQVFASDLHGPSLRLAREGLYPDTIEADVSAERLDRFFSKEGSSYRVHPELRETVVFASHNFLSDPPFMQIDIAVCRNVLIYLQRDLQKDVIRLFHHSLVDDGFLVLGTSETIEDPSAFEVVHDKGRVFRRRPGPRRAGRVPPLPLGPTRPATQPSPRPRPEIAAGSGALHEKMVEQYAPPSILVGVDESVLHVSERAGRYLHVPGGASTHDLVRLVRAELRGELRAALRAAFDRREPTRTQPIAVELEGETRQVILRVKPREADDGRPCALVIFDELDESVERPPRAGDATEEDRARELEAELALVRHRMQTAIDEYESSQEEMRAANEELQSANEELRSTMEELETSREELQSLNEELSALNEENRQKVEELTQVTDDLQNLLSATEIGTLFLDRSLRIQRFTPRTADIFNIRSADRGRPLTDLTHQLGDVSLRDDAIEVLRTLRPLEREVKSADGRWYFARVLPYRTVDERTDGIVMTFVDVTRIKTAEEELRQAEESLTVALDAAEMGAWDLDLATGAITSRNPQHDRIFGYSSAQHDWSLAIAREHVLPEHRGELDAAIARARSSGRLDLTLRIRRPDGDIRWAQIIGRVRESRGGPSRMAGIIVDRTAQKEYEDELARRVVERTTQVRDLVARLARAEQEERRRVSQVLHDDLQQLLYGIQMKLGVLRDDLDGAAREQASGVRDVIERLSIAIDLTRRLTVDLSPPVLHKEDLAEVLSWVRSQMQDLYGLSVELNVTGQARVEDPDLRVLVFQIVRELLFNVAKHAGVMRASVTIRPDGRFIEVEVADAGAGFDPSFLAAEASGESFGLRSARERLRLLAGDLTVDSSPGRGTRVTLRVPAERE